MKRILLTIILALGATIAGAQELINVKGQIKDESGSGAVGAYVLVKGTGQGTSTDLNGNYSINVTRGDVLVISLIGYKTIEVKAEGPTLNLTLEPDAEMLEEVVAIGYGSQKRQDVSGAVASVNSKKLEKIATEDASTALQGMAPGLSVNFASGAPGSEPEMMVRGVTSWGSDNSPLVIIDGVPGSMSYLNPEDIKSVSVLKDAATQAIYGARAAAGVILVETKRGEKATEPRITMSAYYGIDDLPKRMEMCNAAEFVQVRQWALENAGEPQERWPAYISAFKSDPSRFADTDWQKEYYQVGLSQKYDVGYVAGNSNMNVAFSGYYSEIKGIAVATSSDKYGFRLNSDVRRGRWKIGESVNFGHEDIIPVESSGFDTMYQVTNIEPLVFVYDENNDGGFGGAVAGMGMSDAGNPVAFNKLIDTKNHYDGLSASGYISYSPIDGLVFKFQGSDNLNFSHSKAFTPTYQIGALKPNPDATLSESRSMSNRYLMELTSNFDRSFGGLHNVSALLGVSQENYSFNDLSAFAKKFENNLMTYLEHGQKDFAVGGGHSRYGLRSAFGRLGYNYGNRYIAMFSARYDGSSRFAEGNKWGFFPSASLAWNIANERFWEPLSSTVSTFKFRLSYGALGNQGIGNYQYIPTLSSATNSLNYPFAGLNDISLGYAITSLPSLNIKWESTYTSNIGIDLGFLGGKLQMSADAYLKDTRDMLSTKEISSSTGFSAMIVNDGQLKTSGFEYQVEYHGNSGRDFQYDLDLNLSHYRSKLVSMSNPDYLYEYGPARTYVGAEIGEFWVFQTDGLFRSQAEVDEFNKTHGHPDESGAWIPLQPSAMPGDIRFVDQNGDGQLDNDDKVLVGTGNPKLILGFNAYLRYKAFDLSAQFYGNMGAKRYNYTKYQLQRMDQVFNYGKDALDSWRPDNPDTDIPRAVIGDPNGNNRISDRFVENGDFLRLNNLQIGFNLPDRACKKLGLGSLRIYVGGRRLFTLTKYTGYDVTTGASNGTMGVDYGGYPLYRTYMAGIKFGF